MKVIFLLAIISVCCMDNPCYSSNPESPYLSVDKNQSFQFIDTLVENEKESFFKELFTNISIQAKAPFHLTKKEAYYVLGGTCITLGLIAYDQSIDSKVKPVLDRNSRLKRPTNLVTELGGNYGFGLYAAFAGYSFLRNNERGKETSRLLAQALITSTLWSRFAKLLAGRDRPLHLYAVPGYDTDDASRWSGPFHFKNESLKDFQSSKYDAFPSGHTTTAFAIATVFATQYSDYKAVPVIAYSLASVVGITRLVEHQHWASDVFAGACLGYLCGKEVCSHALNFKNKNKDVHAYLNYLNHTLVTGFSLKF